MTAQAEIKIKADPSQLPSGLRAALKMVQGFVHQTTGLMDPKKRKDPDYKSLALGSSIGGVASQLAVRGIDMLVDQTKQVFDFNKELIRFGIDIRKTPKDMEAVGAGIRRISNDTGIGAMEVLKAGRAYADLAGAEAFTMEKMQLISRAAQASGADVKAMAELLFTLTENMKVPPGDLEGTLSGLINQAKDGSIHFKELAHELVALGPVYSQFGVTGREGAIQLGAMMQVARRGFGSAGEAATGVLRILRSLPQHASKFRKFGVEVFEPGSKTKLDSFLNIYDKIKKSKLQMDREQLIKAFGRTEGERFYQLLVMANDEFHKLITAGGDSGTIVRDLGTYTESSAGRIDIAVQRMKNAFAEALTPERIDQIVGGIQRIAEAMPAIMHAVGGVSDAFGAFVRAVRKGKELFGGKSEYKYTDAETDALIDARRRDASPETKARADAILKKKREYDAAISEITGEESDFGPTDASVRKAMQNALPGMGPQGKTTGATVAALAYFSERKSEIPESQFKRIRAQVESEMSAESNKKQAAEAREYWKQIGKDIGDAVSRAINTKPTQVQIDGNPVATAVGNARDNRRK